MVTLPLLLLATALAASPCPNWPVVVLDPGHGGANPGAAGPGGIPEKEVTLDIALRVRRILEERGDVRVVLTRIRDRHLSFRERAGVGNFLRADAFVSIHCNSSPRPGARGYEAYFLDLGGLSDPGHEAAALEGAGARTGERPDQAPNAGDRVLDGITRDLAEAGTHSLSEALALAVDRHMAEFLTGPNRGVRQAPYDVLIFSRIPATVVEVGFLNDPVEGLRLVDPAYQDRIARALALGILDYLGRERAMVREGPPRQREGEAR